MAFSARMSAFNLTSLFEEKISSLRLALFFNSKAPPSIADFFAVVNAFFISISFISLIIVLNVYNNKTHYLLKFCIQL